MVEDGFPLFPQTSTHLAAELTGALDGATPQYADWKYKKIVEQIRDFEAELDDEHEVALRLASFGTSIVMTVTDIGYQNPDMLYFYGIVNGKGAQLIQHISQLNFLLLAVEKQTPNAPPRRIGFALDAED